jgi:hypothetical protein
MAAGASDRLLTVQELAERTSQMKSGVEDLASRALTMMLDRVVTLWLFLAVLILVTAWAQGKLYDALMHAVLPSGLLIGAIIVGLWGVKAGARRLRQFNSH